MNEVAQKLGIKTGTYKIIAQKEYQYLKQIQTTFRGAQRRDVSKWENKKGIRKNKQPTSEPEVPLTK